MQVSLHISPAIASHLSKHEHVHHSELLKLKGINPFANGLTSCRERIHEQLFELIGCRARGLCFMGYSTDDSEKLMHVAQGNAFHLL